MRTLSERKALTLEQQDFVEKNHNLIYDFAYKRNLMLEEYYGVLAIALCKAAISYNDKIGEFSTYAFRVMSNEMNMHWEHMISRDSIPKDMIVYIENKVNSEKCNNDSSDIAFFDVVSSKNKMLEDLLSDIEVKELMKLLTEQEKMVVNYIVSGIKQKEIAKIIGCSQQNISGRILKSVRTKWTTYLSAQ